MKIAYTRYRLREGRGQCIYRVGVDDDGYCRGISKAQLRESIGNLFTCALTIEFGIEASLVQYRIDETQLHIGELTLTIPPEPLPDFASNINTSKKAQQQSCYTGSGYLVNKMENNNVSGTSGSSPNNNNNINSGAQIHDLQIKSRLAVCGDCGSGKSSLIGCLVTNLRSDNGSGLARSLVLQFPHEILQGGATSSMGKHIFCNKSESNNYINNHGQPPINNINNINNLSNNSTTVELIDLPGSARYLKTTLRGILGFNNFAPMLLLHDVSEPFPSPTFRAHMELAKVLRRRIVVLFTKCDTLDLEGNHKPTTSHESSTPIFAEDAGVPSTSASGSSQKKSSILSSIDSNYTEASSCTNNNMNINSATSNNTNMSKFANASSEYNNWVDEDLDSKTINNMSSSSTMMTTGLSLEERTNIDAFFAPDRDSGFLGTEIGSLFGGGSRATDKATTDSILSKKALKKWAKDDLKAQRQKKKADSSQLSHTSTTVTTSSSLKLLENNESNSDINNMLFVENNNKLASVSEEMHFPAFGFSVSEDEGPKSSDSLNARGSESPWSKPASSLSKLELKKQRKAKAKENKEITREQQAKARRSEKDDADLNLETQDKTKSSSESSSLLVLSTANKNTDVQKNLVKSVLNDEETANSANNITAETKKSPLKYNQQSEGAGTMFSPKPNFARPGGGLEHNIITEKLEPLSRRGQKDQVLGHGRASPVMARRLERSLWEQAVACGKLDRSAPLSAVRDLDLVAPASLLNPSVVPIAEPGNLKLSSVDSSSFLLTPTLTQLMHRQQLSELVACTSSEARVHPAHANGALVHPHENPALPNPLSRRQLKKKARAARISALNQSHLEEHGDTVNNINCADTTSEDFPFSPSSSELFAKNGSKSLVDINHNHNDNEIYIDASSSKSSKTDLNFAPPSRTKEENRNRKKDSDDADSLEELAGANQYTAAGDRKLLSRRTLFTPDKSLSTPDWSQYNNNNWSSGSESVYKKNYIISKSKTSSQNLDPAKNVDDKKALKHSEIEGDTASKSVINDSPRDLVSTSAQPVNFSGISSTLPGNFVTANLPGSTTTTTSTSTARGYQNLVNRKSNKMVEQSLGFEKKILSSPYFQENHLKLVTKQKDINLFLRKKNRTMIPALVVSCVTRYNLSLLEYLLSHPNLFPIQRSLLSFYGVRFLTDHVSKVLSDDGLTIVVGGNTVSQLSVGDVFFLGPTPFLNQSLNLSSNTSTNTITNSTDKFANTNTNNGTTVTTSSPPPPRARSRSDDLHVNSANYVVKVRVVSIHFRRQPTASLAPGQSCTLQLKLDTNSAASKVVRIDTRLNDFSKYESEPGFYWEINNSGSGSNTDTARHNNSSTSLSGGVSTSGNNNRSNLTNDSCENNSEDAATQGGAKKKSKKNVRIRSVSEGPKDSESGASESDLRQFSSKSPADTSTTITVAQRNNAASVTVTSKEDDVTTTCASITNPSEVKGQAHSVTNIHEESDRYNISAGRSSNNGARKRSNSGSNKTGGGSSGTKSKQLKKKLLRRVSSLRSCYRDLRPGMCLFDLGSAVPNFFRRYCHVKLKLFSDFFSPSSATSPVRSKLAAHLLRNSMPSHLLLYVHASRQPVKIAWVSPVVQLNAQTATEPGSSSTTGITSSTPSSPVQFNNLGHDISQSNTTTTTTSLLGPSINNNSIEMYDCVAGCVFLRRPELCIPGLQVVAVKDGTRIVAAGEVITTKAMKELTRKED